MAINLRELQIHVEKNHVKKKYGCQCCKFETDSQENQAIHNQVEHQNLRVDIEKKGQIEIFCDQCEYKCRLNIQLKKHKKNNHNIELKYSCSECSYSSDYLVHMWSHGESTHPEHMKNFTPRPKDMVLSLVAEQNMDIIEDIESLKKVTKNSLDAFADKMQECFEAVAKDISYTFKASQVQLKDMADKIDENFKSFDQELQIRKDNDDKTEDSVKENVDKDYRDKKEKLENHINKVNKDEQNELIKTKNLLWVGNSISKALDKNKVEKDLDVKFSFRKAYCVTDEKDAKYPELNFRDVVPDAVEKNSPDVVVLQTGSIEITNFKTNAAMMDANRDINEYKKEWFEKVKKSSEALFEIAEKVTEKNPKIKVIIMKCLPRFDRTSADLLKIKAQLSEFGNSIYQQLWYKKGYPTNIHVAAFELGCTSRSHLKNLIYGNPDNPRYDGVHLCGEGGTRHLTYRAIQAIKSIVNTNKASQHRRPRYARLRDHVGVQYRLPSNQISKPPVFSQSQLKKHSVQPITQ